MQAYKGLNAQTNSWEPVSMEDYKESITYDPNGNILSYLRNGTGGSLDLNNYGYTYTSGTNRLASIYNSVNLQTKTYSYDAIGNTTSDGMQGVTDGVWNVYGKLQSLTNKNAQSVTYTYSADGQRISKKVSDKEEWYVRDATGNIMATYKIDATINSGDLTLTELYKYGSSLLSVREAGINVENPLSPNAIVIFERGDDSYILADGNGNTKVTVSDKKLQHSSNGTTVDYYLADVKTATLHSSFGANAKTYNGGFTQANFNGQRKSLEIGEHSQTAQFWEYNGDVGRRWNVDPRPDASLSVYSSFLNNSVWFSDPLGDTTRIYGNAEVTNSTLREKGGVNERGGSMPGGSFMFKDAKINPVYAKDNKTLVGYNVYDTKNTERTNPILQLDNNADLAAFKENYVWQIGGARLYYSQGEPSEGFKKMSASLGIGSFRLAWEGAKQENKEFWTDPSRVIPLLINIAHSGINLGTTRASNAAVRKWYNQQLKSLNLNVPFTQENATALSAQRNLLKVQARAMMTDRTAAALLDKTDPLRPIDYYIEKYSAQGYTGEALWKKIITGSATPNAEVNSRFGIK